MGILWGAGQQDHAEMAQPCGFSVHCHKFKHFTSAFLSVLIFCRQNAEITCPRWDFIYYIRPI